MNNKSSLATLIDISGHAGSNGKDGKDGMQQGKSGQNGGQAVPGRNGGIAYLKVSRVPNNSTSI
jgi:hypothetical protein